MYSTVVAFSFRIINFLVLVGLGIYLFKKYLLGSIEETIAEQEAYKNGLKQQLGALESLLDELDTEKTWLEKQCTYLKSKVNHWNEQFNILISTRVAEKQSLQKKAEIRVELQVIHLAQEKLLQKALPIALKNATTAFEQSFASQKKGTDYLNNLITAIKRDTHGQ